MTTTQKSVLDLQDILQRFAFDNICKSAFGFDPNYLSPSFPQPETEFAVAFEAATLLSTMRFGSIFRWIWKLKRALDIGSEKQLRIAVSKVREFATNIVREKKKELEEKSSIETEDLLSRILNSGHLDETFATDTVISFILAGRDTTSAALTWFFWLISRNPRAEKEIVKEKPEGFDHYDEVRDMVYTHAAFCESMRLYPPVPSDGKEAIKDDVLPDGNVVKKGVGVAYHPMRWGGWSHCGGKIGLSSVLRGGWKKRRLPENESLWEGIHTHTVFQAGPRICLGKAMAFLQMKGVVAGVMRQFRVVPAENGFEPVFVAYLTPKMKGGFPVRIEERGGE